MSGLSRRPVTAQPPPPPPPPGAGAATPGWGVWASASGGRWEDPCAIQYNAAQLAGNRYDGDPGYRRVRTRATQPEADLDIDHFGRYNRDQPDGVVKLRSCEGGRGDLSGTWRSSTGATWTFTLTGSNASWLRSYANESGTGTVNGNTITGTWRGPAGQVPVTGGFRLDPGGRPIRIDWSNGEVWTR